MKVFFKKKRKKVQRWFFKTKWQFSYYRKIFSGGWFQQGHTHTHQCKRTNSSQLLLKSENKTIYVSIQPPHITFAGRLNSQEFSTWGQLERSPLLLSQPSKRNPKLETAITFKLMLPVFNNTGALTGCFKARMPIWPSKVSSILYSTPIIPGEIN